MTVETRTTNNLSEARRLLLATQIWGNQSSSYTARLPKLDGEQLAKSCERLARPRTVPTNGERHRLMRMTQGEMENSVERLYTQALQTRANREANVSKQHRRVRHRRLSPDTIDDTTQRVYNTSIRTMLALRTTLRAKYIEERAPHRFKKADQEASIERLYEKPRQDKAARETILNEKYVDHSLKKHAVRSEEEWLVTVGRLRASG